jgi:hypothetical protein
MKSKGEPMKLSELFIKETGQHLYNHSEDSYTNAYVGWLENRINYMEKLFKDLFGGPEDWKMMESGKCPCAICRAFEYLKKSERIDK